MHKLFLLIYKSRSFLTFLFLEVIALTLVFKHNVYHNSIFFNSSNQMVGVLFDKRQSINDYILLADANEILKKENIHLRTLLYNESLPKPDFPIVISSDSIDSTNQVTRLAYLKTEINTSDSFPSANHKYEIRSARIIKNSVHQFKNYITLDKGTKDGVKEGMGVVTDLGVVGKVMRVSKNYAVVASLLHTELKVSGRMGYNNVMGTVAWDGENMYRTKLDDVPKHEEVKLGDTIYTSSFNSVFPEGIPIATIKSSDMNVEGGFYDVELELLNNFSSLKNVYIIENKERHEIDSLQAFYN